MPSTAARRCHRTRWSCCARGTANASSILETSCCEARHKETVVTGSRLSTTYHLLAALRFKNHTARAHAGPFYCPVAEWAEAELWSPQRQAQGWLVCRRHCVAGWLAGFDATSDDEEESGDDIYLVGPCCGGKLVQSSKAAHVVIRPGTAEIRNNAYKDCRC